jgi:hypothetical protein
MTSEHDRSTLLMGVPIAGVLLALILAGVTAEGMPGQEQGLGGARNESRVTRGFELTPVQLDLTGKNPSLVGLGSYLVNTLHCSDCHTQPPFAAGGNPFLGQPEQINADRYLAGGRPFGPFLSRNLTPEPWTGLPAGFTLAEFSHVMRTGVDLKNQHPHISPLLQVMPWPWYKDLTEQELRAIYEYLRAIPSVGWTD